MTIHQPRTAFVAARPVAAPEPLRRNRADRVFDLPPALFAMSFACYAAFLLVMGVAFMNPELVLPFAIFGVYLGMYFAVPGWWARVKGKPEAPVQSWTEFLEEGIETGSGPLGGRAAIAQVMILPVLILAWGGAIAAIAAPF